ncbi:MAG: LVIVD repeat-containing protein, partial [Promethearchaeota archaeon]
MKHQGKIFGLIIITIISSLALVKVECKRPFEERDFTINNPIVIPLPYDDIFVEGTNAYTLENEYSALTIFNVTDPETPLVTGRFGYTPNWCGNIFVNNSLMFIPTKHQNKMGFEIINCNNPTDIKLFGQFQTELKMELPEGLSSIFVEGKFAYLAGHRNCPFNGSLIIVDCRDPTNLIEVGRYSSDSPITNLFVRDRFVYLLKYYSELEIIDATNVTNPYKVGEWGDCASGSELYVKDDFVFYADWNEGLRVIDCNNPVAPLQRSAFNTGKNYPRDIWVSDNNAYLVQSGGLVILDISNINDLKKIGKFVPENEGYGEFTNIAVEGDFAYLIKSSYYEDRRLFIIDCSNPAKPKKLFPEGNAPPLWPYYYEPPNALFYLAIIGGPIILV